MNKFITESVSNESHIGTVLKVTQPKNWQVIKDSKGQYLIVMEIEENSEPAD